ncbi:hypothetical protein CKO11_13510 [Rhodobacter sp. TJ_12]|uniref:hypothetical protein n=1 Tax=Rhodobacter sp. TJ_12 TaxID=2029399 RepID=UPI001CBDC921|nr:hypothetical protein [Rhodobacter sp. TJ_12]MBZ4023473.1 hypothetical protein [Rhodobacter sp. TJ_12]
MARVARPKVSRRVNRDEVFSPLTVWGGGALLLVTVVGLFYAVWKSQFAAPASYLFDTPTPGAEAGYCLSVAQMIVPAGAPIGSYFDEAAQFWIKRLRDLDEDMNTAIVRGRAKLMADKQAAREKSNVWFQFAMDRCSTKALNYGAHFRSFE